MAKQQAPLKVDADVDELITNSAHFLGLTKKDLVADAVRAYVEQRREELRLQMQEVMRKLDGTRRARVSLLTGIPPERLDELGGVGE
jgi:Arc/MetJ family transcription regulator